MSVKGKRGLVICRKVRMENFGVDCIYQYSHNVKWTKFLSSFFFKKCSGLFVEMQDFYENSFCMEIFVILFINKIRTCVPVRGVMSSMNGSACAPPTFGENYFYQEKKES